MKYKKGDKVSFEVARKIMQAGGWCRFHLWVSYCYAELVADNYFVFAEENGRKTLKNKLEMSDRFFNESWFVVKPPPRLALKWFDGGATLGAFNITCQYCGAQNSATFRMDTIIDWRCVRCRRLLIKDDQMISLSQPAPSVEQRLEEICEILDNQSVDNLRASGNVTKIWEWYNRERRIRETIA